MKLSLSQAVLLTLLTSQLAGISAVIFTNDTTISPNNTNYDGLDVVMSNCVVTVDGPHAFASVSVAAGGTLTHSASTNGMITMANPIADEPQILTGTNAVTLANSNVITSSVLVKSSGGVVTYTNMLDYVLSNTPDALTTLQRTTNSSIPDGAQVLVSYSYIGGLTNAGLILTVTNDVAVDSGGTINVSGRGYGGAQGAGAGGRD